MTKDKFLRELANALKKLNRKERLEVIRDYQEHFESGLAAGKTESEMIHALGSPKELASEILADDLMSSTDIKEESFGLRSFVTLMVLAFLNITFVLGPALALGGLLFGGWVTVGSFFLAPIMVIVGWFFGNFFWSDFFNSLALSGAGYFLGLGLQHLTKLALNGLNRYIKWNIKLIKGA